MSDRQLLVASAPEGLGDHVVSSANGTVFALVRKDKTTPAGRIVALAHSAEEVLRKVCPPGPETPTKPASKGSPWRTKPAAEPQTADAKQRAAAEMRSELAEYRRACAAAGVTAKLV